MVLTMLGYMSSHMLCQPSTCAQVRYDPTNMICDDASTTNHLTTRLLALAVRQMIPRMSRPCVARHVTALAKHSPVKTSTIKHPAIWLILLFIHLAGDVESNPGPCTVKHTNTINSDGLLTTHHKADIDKTDIFSESSSIYLCKTCKHPVTWEHKGVLCERCDTWSHIECQNIPSANYSKLDHSSVLWYCSTCLGPNYSTTSPVNIYEYPLNYTTELTNETTSISNITIESLDEACEPRHASSPTKHKPAQNRGRPLRILNVNCQSLRNKKGAWINLLTSTKPDIIIATETWLDQSITNSELECDGFTVYRKDREVGIHGGVLIAINSTISSVPISLKSGNNSELLWVKIHLVSHADILVGACYRNDVSNKTAIPDLKSSLEEILNSRQRPYGVVLGGDFNLPGWDWGNNTLKPNTTYVNLHTEFRDFIDDFGLTQHVTEPTRDRNTLDLLCTNMPEQTSRVKVIPGISDHNIVYMELAASPNNIKLISRKSWLYIKADWPGMREFLKPRLERTNICFFPTPDALWTEIKYLLTDAASIFIPRRTSKKKDSCPWIDKELRLINTKKERLFKKTKSKASLKAEQRFKLYRSVAQRQLRRKHAEYVHKLFTDETIGSKERNKRFWTYIKHRRTATNDIIGPLTDGHKLVTDTEEMANLLNNQFMSVFSDNSTPTQSNNSETASDEFCREEQHPS